MLKSAPRRVLPPTAFHPLPRLAALRPLGAVGVALAFVATLLTGYLVAPVPANAASNLGLFESSVTPATAAVTSTGAANVGVKFTTTTSGSVTGLQFYRNSLQKKSYSASLWDASGRLLGRTTFQASSTVGWQTANFSRPVSIQAGRYYTASYFASDGRFAVTRNAFVARHTTADGMAVPGNGGVFKYSSSNLRPTSTTSTNYMVDVVFTQGTTTATPPGTDPVPTTGWPNASNTGVPSGVSLSPYTGRLTITTDGTVIRNRIINGTLNIQASNVQIINSRINGSVDLRSPKTSGYSFTITDSEVRMPDNLATGIMRGNFRATRVEVTGGRRSIYCEFNCVVEDSYVHLQGGDAGGDAHFSGIRMSQNGTFRHNTIACEADRGPGTGCSAALTGYGDTMTVQNNLIEHNRFVGHLGGGSTMCAYGGSSPGKPYPNANRIRFVDNVFVRGPSGKCGNLGAITAFNPNATGNVWQGNTWDDGTTIRSSN